MLTNALLDIGVISTICLVFQSASKVNMDMKVQMKELAILQDLYQVTFLVCLEIHFLCNMFQFALLLQ